MKNEIFRRKLKENLQRNFHKKLTEMSAKNLKAYGSNKKCLNIGPTTNPCLCLGLEFVVPWYTMLWLAQQCH